MAAAPAGPVEATLTPTGDGARGPASSISAGARAESAAVFRVARTTAPIAIGGATGAIACCHARARAAAAAIGGASCTFSNAQKEKNAQK